MRAFGFEVRDRFPFAGWVVVCGCATVSQGLFGTGVDVDRNDASPPSVALIVPEGSFAAGDGPLEVTTEPATRTRLQRRIQLVARTDDPEGARFAEVLDIRFGPWCFATPVSSDGRPPPAPSPRRAPDVTIPGQRLENEAADGRATTRVVALVSLNLPSGESRYCPTDRPNLSGGTLYVRARGGNFGGGEVTTAEATLSVGYTGSGGGPIRGATTGTPSGGGTCAGAGTTCTVTPPGCDGRDGWTVSGTIVCSGDDPVCRASAEDYCSVCGGACGGCVGQSCSEDAPCAPGSICSGEPRVGGTVYTCRSLTIVETSTGNRPCTPLNNICWLPSEADNPTLICAEARE